MISSVACNGLGKRYGYSWALQDCTLSLPVERVIGLVGPNGAGKTTLLHLIVGLLAPSTGSLKVFGVDPQKQPEQILSKVGFVAQEHPLLKSFTVEDMLTFGRKMNAHWDSNFAMKRLKQLNIPLHQKTGKLSGGQQAQVALILALAKNPELLILDEPVASLDPLARREFQQLLLEIVADGNFTVVMSSHIVADLERFCDYLVILSTSHVQVASDVDQLLQSHKLLIGPREQAESLMKNAAVLEVTHGERQSKIMVRDYSSRLDGLWKVQDVSMEDIVLAYLAQSRMDRQVHTHNKEEVLE
ncbi:MAG TPA: ABC transporter ATP-binding protein [Ktedonobacteraceae bacterium]|nr:ABC transporter ATP-binding protein [Ktedonobacteraceae bacterium]